MRGFLNVLPKVFLCLCLFVTFTTSYTFAKDKISKTELYIEDLQSKGLERVIVIFVDEVDLTLVEKYNGNLIRVFITINALVCELPEDNIQSLKAEEKVKDVVPDIVIQGLPGSPNNMPKDFTKKKPKVKDTSAYEEKIDEIASVSYAGTVELRWNVLEAGPNAKAAWDNYDLDGTGVKIAFLDTGVNYTMENLDTNCLGGYDFVNDDDNPINDTEDETHGTIVVSVGVGEGVNKVVGVAYNASYYVLKILDEDGLGLISDCIAAIEWAFTEPHRADIISMSLGIYDEDQTGNPLWPTIKASFENMCNNAYNEGIILIAGSGNRGYDHSGYPAAFENVISVGGHAKDQTLYDYKGHSSNGGVDILAPGARVYSVHPDNSAWWVWGTSIATPHVAALIALQIQHARNNNIEVNNGYLWEVMNHSAVDMSFITDPVYKGNGKIWAAQTQLVATSEEYETGYGVATSEEYETGYGIDPLSVETMQLDLNSDLGSIDLMVSSVWPFEYIVDYSNNVDTTPEGYPAYEIGTNMYQDITLTNITDIYGNTIEDIENLNVTTTQAYYQHEGEVIMPGLPIKVFPTEPPLDAGVQIILSDVYYIPYTTIPGFNRTILDLEFNFIGNSRLIKITDFYAGIWCPPPLINEDFPIMPPPPPMN